MSRDSAREQHVVVALDLEPGGLLDTAHVLVVRVGGLLRDLVLAGGDQQFSVTHQHLDGPGRLIPRERSGEYFGFYNMLGKFAAVLGPVLVGVMATLSGSSRVGISSLMVLFAAGALLLWRVRVPEQAR